MEYATYEGYWWLPENPGHKVAGTLSFDANGLQLVLQGSFVVTDEAVAIRTLANPPEWETIAFIFGEMHDGNEAVTLLRAQGATAPQGPTISVTNMYTGGVALIGFHVSDDSFVEIQCGYDFLAGWAQPASLVQGMGDNARSVTVQFSNEDMAAARVDGAELRLIAGITGSTSGEAVHIERLVKFTIKPNTPIMMAEVIDKWVRGLQDFLIVCLGQSVCLTHFLLRSHEDGPWANVIFEAVQRQTRPDIGISSVISYTAPTLITLRTSPSPFNQLISAWFEVRANFGQALTLLLAPYYAPFIFNEHRFASIFQSVESLAKRKFDGREKSRAEHRDRVAAITEAASAARVDTEDVAWAERVLQSRNDKTMAQRVLDLLTSLNKIGEAVLEASPKFAETVAAARVGVSHPLTVEMDGPARYWHGDVLAWIVRAALLVECGITLQEVEERVTASAPFRHALRMIRVDQSVADPNAKTSSA